MNECCPSTSTTPQKVKKQEQCNGRWLKEKGQLLAHFLLASLETKGGGIFILWAPAHLLFLRVVVLLLRGVHHRVAWMCGFPYRHHLLVACNLTNITPTYLHTYTCNPHLKRWSTTSRGVSLCVPLPLGPDLYTHTHTQSHSREEGAPFFYDRHTMYHIACKDIHIHIHTT